MAYSFNLLGPDGSAAFIREQVALMEGHLAESDRTRPGWACWSIGNHDVPRVLSRWGRGESDPRYAKLLLAALGSLRGSVCVYQGEELGLTEADIPYELLQDPVGITFWPEHKGRDGCRTPMPWQAAGAHGGFSSAQPWLPVPPEHRTRAVDAQQDVPDSVLNFYRTFLRWRREQEVLRHGDIDFVDAAGSVLAFTRTFFAQTWLCAFNLDREPVRFVLPDMPKPGALVAGHPVTGGSLDGRQVVLDGWGGVYVTIERA